MESAKYMATHDGTFHADDVFAYTILHSIFPHYSLVRSRVKEVLDKAEIVFDVGGEKYDHHSTDKVYRENGIPYAAFGLVWRDFGKGFLHLTESIEEKDIDFVHEKLDREFVQAIDAYDNGVNLFTDTIVSVPTISSLIGGFNNRVETGEYASKKIERIFFEEASDLALRLLLNEIIGISKQIQAREGIKKAFFSRRHPLILELEEAVDWGDTVDELDINKELLFVTYPRTDGYYIEVMRKEKNSFDARKDLPASWAGKRDDALNQVTGLEDAIFCHPARFLAGAKSKESILKMAELALQD